MVCKGSTQSSGDEVLEDQVGFYDLQFWEDSSTKIEICIEVPRDQPQARRRDQHRWDMARHVWFSSYGVLQERWKQLYSSKSCVPQNKYDSCCLQPWWCMVMSHTFQFKQMHDGNLCWKAMSQAWQIESSLEEQPHFDVGRKWKLIWLIHHKLI